MADFASVAFFVLRNRCPEKGRYVWLTNPLLFILKLVSNITGDIIFSTRSSKRFR